MQGVMIKFHCGCGKKYSTRDEDAGRSIPCPSCGRKLVVPAPKAGGTKPATRVLGTVGAASRGPGASAPVRVRPTDRCALLLEASRPDLYLRNAFRIAELPVSATSRDITRQVEKLEMMQRLGTAPPRRGGVFPLNPAPDGDAIRDALSRLRDPERRLLDEFFWFWPQELDPEKRDKGLDALSSNDTNRAIVIWRNKEELKDVAHVSRHNLAVLYHLSVLGLETSQRAHALSPDMVAKRDGMWRESFNRWRTLISDDRFWGRLQDRIEQLDDPRLNGDTSRSMRSELPLALLLVQAQLAYVAAEQGNAEEVARHLRVMRASGFEPSTIDDALSRVVEPVSERVQLLCRTAEPEADANPEKADRVFKRLLVQTQPLLAVLDLLLPKGHATREAAHDEVALRCLACIIPYGNKTEDWETCLTLLKPLPGIAESESTRGRIEENLRRLGENQKFDELYEACWFCKEFASDPEAVIEAKLYGNVTRTPTIEGTRVRWETSVIKVPRCNRCKGVHQKVDRRYEGTEGTMGALVVGLTVAGIAAGLIWLGWWCLTGFVGLIVGFVLAAVYQESVAKKKGALPEGVSGLLSYYEFPPVKDKLAQGWSHGEGPPGATA